MDMKDIIGKSYKLAPGIIFKVLSIEAYSVKKVSKQYENILAIKPGYLAAISYRGTLIPNITAQGGVVRLMSVEVDGKTINKPGAISKALGLENSIDFYLLKKLS